MTAETSNARGEAEYEYEVWQGDDLQAGGSTTDYASAQSEAGHYAMMYASGGPVEVRIYEKRLLTDEPPSAAAQQQAHGGGEVVQRLRGVLEHGKMGDKCLIAPDLVTAAIASLSAQQSPAEAQPVAKLVNRKDADGGKTTTFIRPTSLGMDLPLGEYPLHLHPPPSAPVGVEAIAAEIRASLVRGATVCTRRRWAIELEALAQQLAAVDASDARDAERYRWLRRALLGAEDEPIDHLLLEKEPETEAEFDAAVDAALAAQHQEPTT